MRIYFDLSLTLHSPNSLFEPAHEEYVYKQADVESRRLEDRPTLARLLPVGVFGSSVVAD
jgi:hypothetical protein